MKRWLCILSACVAGLMFTACSGEKSTTTTSKESTTTGTVSAAPGGKTNVEFWHYFTGEHAKVLGELVKRFEQDNPDVHVNLVYQGKPLDLSQKLSGSFATNPPNNPAMATVYENWTSDYVSKGLMDAVEDHFAGPDGLTSDSIQDIIKVFRDGNTWNGKIVTMPFNKSIYVLYLNQNKLAEAGFTTAPKTRDEFGDAICKTTKRDASRVVTYGLGVAPVSEAFTTQFYAGGGSYFDDKGNPSFDGPDGLAALTFLKNLKVPESYLYVTTDYMDAPLGNGQIAMFVYSSASFPFVKKSVGDRFKSGIAPIPGPADKDSRYLMQGTNLGIFKGRSEAERNAAWKLVKFLTNTQNAVQWVTKTGYMPIRYSMLKDADMQSYMSANPNYATAAGLVLSDKGKQEPRMAEWEGIREDLNNMVDRVLNKGGDPAAELATAKTKVIERMKRSGKAVLQ